MLHIEEFELAKPEGYEDRLRNADKLFAELLIRYYFSRKHLTKVNYNTMIEAKEVFGEEKEEEKK